MSAPRGNCSVCGRSIALRKDGTLRDHQDLKAKPTTNVVGRSTHPWCYGSGLEPVKRDS